MDPYDEQRLRNEVIYLHYLWHQGPPTNTNTNLNPNPNPITPSNIYTRTNRKRAGGQSRERPTKKPVQSITQQPVSTTQWPCPTPAQDRPPETSYGWPEMRPILAPSARPVSAEEQARHSQLQFQYRALDACHEFFSRNEDDDEDDGDGDDDDEWVDDHDDGGEKEELDFFLKLFTENNELRTFYEENSEGGEFVCLVCSGVEKKKKNSKKKTIKGCSALVQHSFSISKTAKKRAHRTFGKVICRVMGWDVDRLPVIVAKGEPLGRSLAKAREMQGDPEANADKNEDVSDVIAENAVTLNVKQTEPAETDECDGQQNGGVKSLTCE